MESWKGKMRLRNIKGAKEKIASSELVVQEPRELKGKWAQKFKNENPIYIEVGMGKGQFIMELAKQNPQINYLGIEMYHSVLLRAVQKLEKEDVLPNLFFICMDARELPEVFAKGEVDRIYLNFSDPWPKDRHAKRRLTSHEFLERYDAILAEGGQIEFKTDNRELFEFSLQEAENLPWQVKEHTFDLHTDDKMNGGNIMTEYEKKFAAIGNPINKMIVDRENSLKG